MANNSPANCNCPGCGATFYCAAAAGEKKCWCFEYSPINIDAKNPSCYCPACLEKKSSARTSPNS